MQQEAVEATAIAAGNKAMAGGAATTVGSWALSSEGGVAIGVFIALLGYLTSLYFGHRRDKREARAAHLDEIERKLRIDRLAAHPEEET